MKMEIEKERQKMIKEFKEMQDNLYCKRSYFIYAILAMNKKSLNIPSTSEVNQNNEAPLDVFLKRLSRSSIS
jgi:DNA-binding transcriptional regulator GbsR (MarR family)